MILDHTISLQFRFSSSLHLSQHLVHFALGNTVRRDTPQLSAEPISRDDLIRQKDHSLQLGFVSAVLGRFRSFAPIPTLHVQVCPDFGVASGYERRRVGRLRWGERQQMVLQHQRHRPFRLEGLEPHHKRFIANRAFLQFGKSFQPLPVVCRSQRFEFDPPEPVVKI